MKKIQSDLHPRVLLDPVIASYRGNNQYCVQTVFVKVKTGKKKKRFLLNIAHKDTYMFTLFASSHTAAYT